MDDKIREAYDQMNPTPEQEERMLASLREAQSKVRAGQADALTADARGAAGTPDATGASSAPGMPGTADGAASFEARPAPERKRGGFSAWKIVAPIAACLVVGAVAVGVGALGQSGGNSAAVAPTPASASSAANPNSAQAEPSANAKAAPEGEMLMREEMAADSAYEGGVLGTNAMAADPGDAVVPEGKFNTEE